MKYFKRKRLSVLFFIGLILVSYDPILSNGQATPASNQKDNKSPEEPLIINENTVAFLALSQKDYDLLVSKDPELKAQLPDILGDFLSYSDEISKILDKMGIAVKYGTSKQIWFQHPDGQIEKMTFNPEDIYGMALFAKGKAPKLVAAFGANIEPMAMILSEYFQIKIEWRMTSGLINNDEQIIDWDKIRSSFDAYLEYPSPENAKAFLDTLPRDKIKVYTETANKVVDYIYTFRNLAILENEIWAGDRYSTEAAFRLFNIADRDFAEELNMTLGALVRINPGLFLEVLYEYKDLWLFKDRGYPVYGVGPGYEDRIKTRIYELEMRIKALESVKTVKYLELREECIRQLREAIWKISKDRLAMRVDRAAYK
jgi:hypothetical protein